MKSWRYENWCTCGAYLTRTPTDLSWRDARGDSQITLMGQRHRHVAKYSQGDEAIPEEALGTDTPPLPMPYQGPKPKHPREYGAIRFFAQVGSFVCECPYCGTVASVLRQNQHAKTAKAAYNPKTARFRCLDCKRQYVVGLLLWPEPRGGGSKGIPDDQVPGPRQLAQLRADGAGYWLPDSLRETAGRMDTSNLTGEADRPEPEDALELDLTIHPQENPHARTRRRT